jgi:hypothetical protein
MSGNLKLNTTSGGSVALTPADTVSNITVTVPATAGTMLTSSAASVSVINTVTNKIPVVIGGVTYYLLASTSAL